MFLTNGQEGFHLPLISKGWKVFIPLAFVNIFVVAALVLLRGNS